MTATPHPTADAGAGRPAANPYRVALVLLVLGTYAAVAAWPDAMIAFGIGLPGDRWFVDLHALLAASDAFALGLDPYQPNPLDWLHVPHWYSDWWFWLHDVGLDRTDTFWLGGLIGAGFLAAALTVVRPRDFCEMLTAWLVISAPVSVLGVNRANPDLLILAAFVVLVRLLASPVRPVWLLGAPLIAGLAGLKFYPLAGALALPFAPRVRRERWASLALMAALTLLLALGLHDDVRRVAALIDAPGKFYTFGGPRGFILAGLSPAPASWLTLGAGAGLGLGWWLRPPALPATLPDREVIAFVLGAATNIGCFMVGVSYGYRLVFAVLMLPLLGTLRLGPAAEGTRRLAGLGLAGILILTWFDGLFSLGWNLTLGAVPPAWIDLIGSAAFLTAALLGWIWVGLMAGLLVGLVRPACRRLLQAG